MRFEAWILNCSYSLFFNVINVFIQSFFKINFVEHLILFITSFVLTLKGVSFFLNCTLKIYYLVMIQFSRVSRTRNYVVNAVFVKLLPELYQSRNVQLVSYRYQHGHKLSYQCQKGHKLLNDQCQTNVHDLVSYLYKLVTINANPMGTISAQMF